MYNNTLYDGTIIQFDNFLSDKNQQLIEDRMFKNSWGFFHAGNPLEESNKFWSFDVEKEQYFNDTLFHLIKEKTQSDFIIKRIYFAGHTACSSSNLHHDSKDPRSKTFLIYCNKTWNPEFGGNTSFIINDDHISIYPKPLSALYFDGTIPHTVQPMSRIFNGLRVSLVYKLWKK